MTISPPSFVRVALLSFRATFTLSFASIAISTGTPSVAASTITSATRQIICDVAYAMLMLGTVLMGWRLNGQTNHAPAPTVMALELAEGTVRVLDRVDRVLLERVDGVFVFGIVWRFS
jgi:hypothetical protein